jgi:hypothetical protein
MEGAEFLTPTISIRARAVSKFFLTNCSRQGVKPTTRQNPVVPKNKTKKTYQLRGSNPAHPACTIYYKHTTLCCLNTTFVFNYVLVLVSETGVQKNWVALMVGDTLNQVQKLYLFIALKHHKKIKIQNIRELYRDRIDADKQPYSVLFIYRRRGGVVSRH